MAKMMYRDAVVSTIAEEMERDENVVCLGEDIVGGMGRLRPGCSASSALTA